MRHNIFRVTLATAIFSLILIMLSSCGFKLKRDNAMLPGGAKFLAFTQTQNHTFLPGADISLRQALTKKFTAQKSIFLVSPKGAQQSLSFNIVSATTRKIEYSKSAQGLIEHHFTIIAKINLQNIEKKKDLIRNRSISGSYTIKKLQTDLSEFEKKEGYAKAVKQLAENIYTVLTTDF